MSVIAAYIVPHPPMIIPDIGRGSEKEIQKTIEAYEYVAEEIAALRPETIVISSPHAVMYADYFHISPGKKAYGSFADFNAPKVTLEVAYDTEFVQLLNDRSFSAGFPAGCLGEKKRELDHGTMVPLWFLLKKYQDFQLVRTGLSGLDLLEHYQYGRMIKETAEALDRRVVYVASGDLSHKLKENGPYGFVAEGPEYDRRLMEVCAAADFGKLFDFDENFCDKAAECGHRSFVIMAGALDEVSVKAKVCSHEDVTGVGYGICSFIVGDKDESRAFLQKRLMIEEQILEEKKVRSDVYVRLARASVEEFVKNGNVMKVPDWVPQELLNQKAGAFVSVHKFGRLRGCIGTILATKDNLAKEIIRNAVSAVSEDDRFDPVEADELKWLDINVDVLSEPEKIASENALDVKRYGVIVQCGQKRGLLLPDLDGVDTVKQQISIAMRKGNIPKGSRIELYRFEVVRHV